MNGKACLESWRVRCGAEFVGCWRSRVSVIMEVDGILSVLLLYHPSALAPNPGLKCLIEQLVGVCE